MKQASRALHEKPHPLPLIPTPPREWGPRVPLSLPRRGVSSLDGVGLLASQSRSPISFDDLRRFTSIVLAWSTGIKIT